MAWLLLGAGSVAAASYIVEAMSESIIKPIDDYVKSFKEERALKLQENNKIELIHNMKQRQSNVIAKKYNYKQPIKMINNHLPCDVIFVNINRTNDDETAIELLKEDKTRWIKKFQWIPLHPYKTVELLPIEIESYKIILHRHDRYQVLKDFKKDIKIKHF